MKILVGYPPLKTKKEGTTPTLGQNRQYQEFANACLIFPIVPASTATLLKEKGHQVIWKDCIAEKTTKEEFYNFLEKEKPELFIFETKTPTIKRHWEIINNLKKDFPNMKIAICGDHVTHLPEETLKNSKVDYVLTGGDYDFLSLGLVNYLEKEKELPKGIYYKEKDKIKSNGKFELKNDLNSLPIIDRELTKANLYDKEYNIPVRPFAYIMSGRDCWWGKCTFCAWTVLYPNFRTVSVEKTLDEIGYLIDKYKVKEIFNDSGTHPCGNWLKDFCNGMIERGYNKKITYSCNMRFGALKLEDYKLMKKAGFRLLKFGLESANQSTLDKLNKNIKVEDIKQGCKWAKEAGLTVHLTMIVGYPWETKKDALKTYKLAKELMQKGYADVLQSTIIMPYPGTPLYDESLKNNWFLIDPKDYDKFDMSEPILKTIDMSSKEVKDVCNKIYKIFITPKYILTHLKRIKSLNDIKYTLRGVKAVIGHLKDFKK